MCHVTRLGSLPLFLVLSFALPLAAAHSDACSPIEGSGATYKLFENANEITTISNADVWSGYILLWEDDIGGTLSDYVFCAGPDMITLFSDGAPGFSKPDCSFGQGCVNGLETGVPVSFEVCNTDENCNIIKVYSDVGETEVPEPASLLMFGAGLLVLQNRFRKT